MKTLELIKAPAKITYKNLLMMKTVINLAFKDSFPENLEIGSGPSRRNGWITLDLCRKCDVYWDLSRGIPFPDNSFSLIYSSHVLEHFPYKDLKVLLNEIYRVLKPGGVMSTCVPDASIYIDMYNKKRIDSELYLEYKPAYISERPMDALNYLFYMAGQHKHMFDIDNMLYYLSEAGFINCRARDFDPNLDSESRKHTSFYVDCQKPF